MEFNISLTLEETNVVLVALNKLPYETVNALIPKIVNQANSQAAEKQQDQQKAVEAQ